MRNPIDFLPLISRIAQAIGIDGSMFGIGQKRKANLTFSIRRDLPCELSTHVGRINADGVQTYLFIFFQKRSQSSQLPGAERSPVTAIEDQHHWRLAD